MTRPGGGRGSARAAPLLACERPLQLLLPLLLAATASFRRAAAAPECPQHLTAWVPECWAAEAARITFGGDRTVYWTPFTSDKWGNALSGYWQARALAQLAGYGFDAYVGFEGGSWLAHLPKRVPPRGCGDPAGFAAACAACDADAWAHAHRCAGPWASPGARRAVRRDTRAAVEAWAAAEGVALPRFDPGDVVIQVRCAHDTVLAHPEYGPAGFSFYTANIDASKARRILLVADARSATPLCAALAEARREHLAAAFPGADVQLVGSEHTSHDFFRLLRAPVLFRDSQSSFGLWAGVANEGQVYSVPLLARYGNNTTPDLGPDWHWVDAPVLYPAVAEVEGITLEQPERIIAWLKAH